MSDRKEKIKQFAKKYAVSTARIARDGLQIGLAAREAVTGGTWAKMKAGFHLLSGGLRISGELKQLSERKKDEFEAERLRLQSEEKSNVEG